MKLNRDRTSMSDMEYGTERVIKKFIQNIRLLSEEDLEYTLRNIIYGSSKCTVLESIAVFNGVVEEFS